MKAEKGWHSGVGVNRHPSCLEKCGDTCITLAGCHEAPSPDQTCHDKSRAVLGDPVGQHNSRPPVAIAERQRGCRLAPERHHDVEAFKLPAKRGSAFDITIVILGQKSLAQQRGIACIAFERAEEKVGRLPNVIEIQRLPGGQVMSRSGACIVVSANHGALFRC